MSSPQEKCSICLKPKRQSGSASLTQWINVCRCQSGFAEQELSRQYCGTCGKQITASRPGSFTQWIFGSNRCSCARPNAVANVSSVAVSTRFDTAVGAPDFADLSGSEEELSPVPRDFPIKRYRPLSELGRGASGTVYLCRDRLMGTKVAVKVLHGLTEEQLLSFQQEAKISSRLDHPNIVKILDFGPTESGAPYMVMQYAQGVTLQHYLSEHGPMQEALAVQIFSQVCQALDHAHGKGVFHRDLKPSNIVLVSSEKDSGEKMIKLIDFGVARVKEQTQEPTIVQGRTIAGTPSYMPPEIVSGKQFDARSEIYSLGCVIFEAVVGHAPFRGESPLAIILKQVNDAAPIPSVVAGKPLPNLDDIVATCLEKDPARRFQSAAELMDRLGSLEQTSGSAFSSASTSASIETNKKSRFTAKALAMFVVPLLVVAGIIYALQIGAFLPDKQRFQRQSEADPFNRQSQKAQSQSKQVRTDADELYKRGMNYRYGTGVKQNDAEAFKWLSLAAEKGNAAAQHQVYIMLVSGQGVAKDENEATKWLSRIRSAAENGNSKAQSQLGLIYVTGEGVTCDYRQGLLWFRRAAENGDADAAFNLGVAYRDALGVNQDLSQAARWLSRSAELGNGLAKTHIAIMYRDGKGFPRSYEKAMKWFAAARESGDGGRASYFMGLMYSNALGVKQDYAEAMKLYIESYSQGYNIAAYSIGKLYEHGLGVSRNYEEAMKWYHRADAPSGTKLRGEIDASISTAAGFYGIGNLYRHGLGVSRNYKEAMKWYRLAAEQQVPSTFSTQAQNEIAAMYEHGLGVRKDLREASIWSLRARQNFIVEDKEKSMIVHYNNNQIYVYYVY